MYENTSLCSWEVIHFRPIQNTDIFLRRIQYRETSSASVSYDITYNAKSTPAPDFFFGNSRASQIGGAISKEIETS